MGKRAKSEGTAESMMFPPIYPDDQVRQTAIKLIKMGLELLEQQDIYYPMKGDVGEGPPDPPAQPAV